MQTNQEETKDKSIPFSFDLSFLIADFEQEWVRCNMAANYIAAYAAYEFPQRERIENLISTITNELLETAVCIASSHSDLQIRYKQLEDGLYLDMIHSIREEIITPYTTLLGLLTGKANHNALYLKLLTDEEEAATHFNQLGLTMITHDFGAQLAANLTNGSSADGTSTKRMETQLFIPIKELYV